jgi:soluble cytochrome b562
MKKRTVLFGVLLASCILSPLALRAQPPVSAHEETELEGKMDALNGAFRKLRRQIGDATKNAESLKLVEEIRRAADEGAKLIPAKAAGLAESERAKFVADYQGKMKAFGAKVTELEAALKADKNEEAAKILAALGAMQKEGHKEFRKPERR